MDGHEEERVPREQTTIFRDGAGRRGNGDLPDTIGRYPILGALGAGGMGVVYLARDPELGREIAIKTLPPTFATDADRVARFRREARTLAMVNHPSVTTIYSIETTGPEPFLTMEYVPGETLASRIDTTPLQVDGALRIARQVAAAVEAAHAKGVIHRDLKPANVRVTPDGAVKVLDFGLACVVEPASARARGEMAGTPGFMSPEQLRGEPADPTMDVWAFGCLLHAMLVGRSPFARATVRETIAATLEREADLAAVPAGAEEGLRALIAGCLARAPEERPATMQAVRRAIDTLRATKDPARDALPRDVSRTPSNLRHRPTPLIGREQELATLGELMKSRRLVTLTGPGGCGKTRLALELAWTSLASAPGGVWFVELAAVRDPSLVVETVMVALDLREARDVSAVDVVAKHLQGRSALLILDNCEHLVDAVAELCATLLDACPDLRLLTTSRETLAVVPEHVLSVPPLRTPPRSRRPTRAAKIADAPAIHLFMERAREVNPSLTLTDANAPTVLEICRRLDGLPLALELAAARVRVLSLEELERRLDKRFDLLAGVRRGALPQHRTLRALIDWSYELLEAPERTVLRRLSAFSGSWTIDGAEAVCAGGAIEPWEVLDPFTRLLEKSLVERLPGHADPARFRMLETVREYSRERLEEAGEVDACLAACRAHLLGVIGVPGDATARPVAVTARIEAELPNLRAAFDPAGPVSGEELLAYADGMGRFWRDHGLLSEGRRACEAALAHPANQREGAARARVLSWAGNMAWKQGDYDHARPAIEEQRRICRLLGDRGGEARAIGALGLVAWTTGSLALARDLYEECLAIQREIGDSAAEAASLNNLGLVAKYREDSAAARRYYEQSLAIRLAIGDPAQAAVVLNNLGNLASVQGDWAAAHDYLERSGALYREMGDPLGEADILSNRGNLAIYEKDLAEAAALLRAGLLLRHEHEDMPGRSNSLVSVAAVAVARGEHAEATRLFAAGEAVRERIGRANSPAFAEELESERHKLREALGTRAFEREWVAGSGMSLDAAVALALDVCERSERDASDAAPTQAPGAE